ncbi:nickel-dependent lactate racemase [Paenibacillus sp. YYML68]|uniref:nickel-dependent lactate racemase n=1 Tax=Paenibacillus sp. YYML68 TaxID=2909250 RepID=UPI00249079D7|nr:nickel-dependent lactate racemase [Paenibacillus sp. YYML68]
MLKPSIRYGHSSITLSIPASCSWDTISYKQSSMTKDPLTSKSIILQALANPIGSPPLHELARGIQSATILIPDGTRLCPSGELLGPILDELNASGLPDDQIEIIVALGFHRKHTHEELRELVSGPIYERVRVSNHSCLPEHCELVGTTRLGTPVEINRQVVASPLRIAIGNIEPHSLVGVSGGVKALVPGVASKRCIEHNHSLSLTYTAVPGNLDNPIHQDLEEAHQLLPIHFILNVIVDHERHVLEAFAGDVKLAHAEGARKAKDRFVLPVNRQYELVIASTGGYPKDLQMYQALKTLRNAAAFTKPGGTILLAAQCAELLGNGMFQLWIDTMGTREEMAAKLRAQFVLGAHKVLHLQEVLEKHEVYLLSALPRALTQQLGFRPVEHLDDVLEPLVKRHQGSIAIMPFGALTYPEG